MTDWPALIADLRMHRSDWKIAQAIGYAHPKEVEAIVAGRIPRHDVGERLIRLHTEMCPTGHVCPSEPNVAGQ